MSAHLDHYPVNPSYGSGVFRRRIVRSGAVGEARAELFDDFHEMAVALRIEMGVVAEARGRMARFPKTTCQGAIASLKRLHGRPAVAAPVDVDRREQCTHLLDLATLALSWFGAGAGEQVIEIALTDRDSRKRQHLDLRINGEIVLEWDLVDEVIVWPEVYAGTRLFGGFGRWIERTIGSGDADLWRMAQMAVFVARGRAYIVDGPEAHRVSEEPERQGACFSYFGAAFDNGRDNIGYVQDLSSGLPPYPNQNSAEQRR